MGLDGTGQDWKGMDKTQRGRTGEEWMGLDGTGQDWKGLQNIFYFKIVQATPRAIPPFQSRPP